MSDALTVSLCATPNNDRVLVTLTPPLKPEGSGPDDIGKRTPLDICCVLDVSGSMAASAKIPNAWLSPGEPEFTVLDVVKHSVRTIIASMQEDDRIAIVTFSDNAEVIADFTAVDAVNKEKLLHAVNKLEPMMSTNLWDGLQTGMDLIISAQSPASKAPIAQEQPTARQSRYTSLFLLTDGMPNVVPAAGHMPSLMRYLDSCDPTSAHSFTIHTFGFGYSIDTPLLLDIAKTGGGGYNFIPDAGMVGTVFVNAVATAYATYAQHVKVEVQMPVLGPISPISPKPFKMELKGQIPFIETNRGIRFDAADIPYGQPKYYVLDITPSFTSPLHASAIYRPVNSSVDISTDVAVLSPDQNSTPEQITEIEYRSTAFQVATVLLDATSETRERSAAALEDLKQKLTTMPELVQHPNAAALARDIGGESKAGLATPANFERWGKHWGSSYANAHQRQHCQNFKDTGLQAYGGSPMIQRERINLEKTFHNSPVPSVPSVPFDNLPQFDPTLLSPIISPSQLDISPSGSSILSLDESSGFDVPNNTPSPTYREIRRHHAQYATDPTSMNSRRLSTADRVKKFLHNQQPQSPLAAVGARFGKRLFARNAGPSTAQFPKPPSPAQSSKSVSPFSSIDVQASPMSRYYDLDAPCYTAEGLVRTPNGAIRVDQLRRGTAVQTLTGPRTVAAVVRTSTHGRRSLVCRLGELVITPWHPVMVAGRWAFPAHVVEPEPASCEALYSVLLEPGDDGEVCVDAHSVCVSDVWTVTLGHGVGAKRTMGEVGDVRAHAFFGDYDTIVRDLSNLDGFFDDGGIVECEGVRRGVDGKICGFVGKSGHEGNTTYRPLLATITA